MESAVELLLFVLTDLVYVPASETSQSSEECERLVADADRETVASL